MRTLTEIRRDPALYARHHADTVTVALAPVAIAGWLLLWHLGPSPWAVVGGLVLICAQWVTPFAGIRHILDTECAWCRRRRHLDLPWRRRYRWAAVWLDHKFTSTRAIVAHVAVGVMTVTVGVVLGMAGVLLGTYIAAHLALAAYCRRTHRRLRASCRWCSP